MLIITTTIYEFLASNPLLTYGAIMLITLGIVFIIVKWLQDLGLEKIRETVYQGFLKAEHTFQHGDNQAKFDYVIKIAKEAIPAPFNLFITEKLLREVVQLWFDLIKDLLDDGKVNHSKDK